MLVREAAEYLRVSNNTVRLLITRGEISYLRIGSGQGRIRLTKAGLDAYLASRCQAVKGEAPVIVPTVARPKVKDYFPGIPRG